MRREIKLKLITKHVARLIMSNEPNKLVLYWLNKFDSTYKATGGA